MMDAEKWHETGESIDAGKHGKDYEISIAKFIFKRLMDGNVPNFEFTREKRGLGKFDDLAYIYENNCKEKQFCLVQLKHVLDSTKKISYTSLTSDKKSYFYLPMYFQYYKESMQTIAKDDDFTDAKLQALFMCTNIGLDDNLNHINKVKLDNSDLFFNAGFHFKFEITSEQKRKIFYDSYLTDMEMLAKELTEYIMFKKRINIKNLKKDDHVSMIKIYHVALAKYVIDVERKELKPSFLEKATNTDSPIGKFQRCFLNSVNDFCTKYQNMSVDELKLQLKLKQRASEELQTRFQHYKSVNSIPEFLEEETLEVDSHFGDISLYPNDPVDIPAQEALNPCAIDDEIDNFLNLLVFATEVTNTTEIIQKEMTPELFNLLSIKMEDWYHSGSYEDKVLALKKRKWLCKKKILGDAMEQTIIFQGVQVKLKYLIDDDKLISSEALFDLFCEKKLFVGHSLDELGDTRHYYIPRTLLRNRIIIERGALKDCVNDVFIIMYGNGTWNDSILQGVSPAKIERNSDNFNHQIHNVIVTDGSKNYEFEYFQNHPVMAEKNIHWLKVGEREELIWHRTQGNFGSLRNYIKNNPFHEICIEDELKYHQFITLYGEPGMGKSTLVNRMLHTFGRNDPQDLDWVIKISLKDWPEILYKFHDLKEVVELLAFSENAKDTFSKNILEHFLKKDQRVILLLDGYDELCSNKQRNVLTFLTFLQNNVKLKQLVIASRPRFKNELQKFIDFTSFSLKEIDESGQISFLTNFWSFHSSLGRKKIVSFAEDVICRFRESVTNHGKSFLGIPLQTFMVATVFLDYVKKNELQIPKVLSIADLFEKFLQTKYNIFLQKAGVKDIIEGDKHQQLLRTLLDLAHQDFAVLNEKWLFYEEEIDMIGCRNHIFDEAELLDTGIIYKLTHAFHFTHQTFAEYLVSKKLIKCCFERAKGNTTLYELLYKHLCRFDGLFLQYIFDLKMVEHFPLHHSVMNGEEAAVKNFSSSDSNSEDQLSRTPLYYALQYSQYNIVNILINKGAKLQKDDKFSAKALMKQIHHRKKDSYFKEQECKTLDSYQPWYNNLAEQILSVNVALYPPQLIKCFCFSTELNKRNWHLVELIIHYQPNIRNDEMIFSFVPLIRVLESNPPVKILCLFLDRRKTDKHLTKSKSFNQYIHLFPHFLVLYSSKMIAKFLLERDTSDLKFLFQNYVKDFIEIFNETTTYSSSRIYIVSAVLKEYLSLPPILANHPFSYILSSFKQRATNFGIIVEGLFLQGICCFCNYEEAHLTEALSMFIPLISSIRAFNDSQSLKYLNDTIAMKEDVVFMKEFQDLWMDIQIYENEGLINKEMHVKEAVMRIFKYELNSSPGIKLISLFNKLHKGIEDDDESSVSNCLQEARELELLNPLLCATNFQNQTAEKLKQSFFITNLNNCQLQPH